MDTYMLTNKKTRRNPSFFFYFHYNQGIFFFKLICILVLFLIEIVHGHEHDDFQLLNDIDSDISVLSRFSIFVMSREWNM